MFSMMGFISKLSALLAVFFNAIKVKHLLAFLLVGMMVFATVAPAEAAVNQTNRTFRANTSNILDDDDSDRPKTFGEWETEAQETEDQPLERAKRIVGESAEAVKDWAELYPDVAERSIPALQDDNQ